MLGKAERYSPDAFVPDMEDSVPPDEKANARQTIADALPDMVRLGKPIIPRINSLESGHIQSDIQSVVGHGIIGVSVGKVRSAEAIQAIDQFLLTAELASGTPRGSTFLFLWIETASGIINVSNIVAASPRVQWIAFGADDFTADMEMPRARNADPADEIGLIYPRSAVAVAAKAAGIQALDTPYVAYRDEPGLVREAEFARRMGFTGKCAIHPSQIEPINRVFSPSQEEIDYARRVLEVWDEATRRGSGATSLDGDLIDTPVVERAHRLLASLDQGNSL
ncbi:MAG: CoA ester lyase [Chloroflexi bacterium]|nr:CoA ester lyase [Chloroflexota bacterium]